MWFFLFILYQFKFDGRCSLLWRLQLDFKILKTCKIHINCQGWKVKKFERWKWKMIFWFLFLGLSFDKWYSAKVETDPINKQSKHHLVITNKRFWERRNIFLSLVSFQCQSLSNLNGAKVNILMENFTNWILYKFQRLVNSLQNHTNIEVCLLIIIILTSKLPLRIFKFQYWMSRWIN